MKRLLTVFSMILLGCLITVNVQAAVWKVGHIRPADSEIHRDLTWLAGEVYKQTEGRLEIKIYGNSQLGDYTIVQERVSIGAVEMSCESIATQVDKKLLIGTLQYVVSDYERGKEVFGSGGSLANYITKLFEKQEIKVLAWWPVYFGGIGLTKEPIAPTDPDVPKNIKVRVPTMKTFEVLATCLGYQGTPLPFSEFFTAAQTGIVNGIVGGGAESYYASFKDIIKYYVPANTHFEIWPLLVNAEAYDKLSAADKLTINKLAAEFEANRWAKAEADQAHYEKLLEGLGVKIYYLTPEELAKFAKKGRENVFPEFKKIVGAEAYDEIFKSVKLD